MVYLSYGKSKPWRAESCLCRDLSSCEGSMNLKLCIRPNLTIAPFCKDTNIVCSFIIASTLNEVYLTQWYNRSVLIWHYLKLRGSKACSFYHLKYKKYHTRKNAREAKNFFNDNIPEHLDTKDLAGASKNNVNLRQDNIHCPLLITKFVKVKQWCWKQH